MIVVGDVSGIQRYLFDVAEEGGGQARRLRARSFFLQLLAEGAALRILRKLDWPLGNLILSAAGKFVLQGTPPQDVTTRLQEADRDINAWLLRETAGEVSFALAASDGARTPAEQLTQAMTALQRSKLRPWGSLAASTSGWQANRIQLPPLDSPCVLCRRRSAVVDDPDPDSGENRRICRQCADDARLGRSLPRARWLVIVEAPADDDFQVLGFGIRLASSEGVPCDPKTVAVANLVEFNKSSDKIAPHQFLPRRLARHVPSDEGGPVWFTELAARARGAPLLGVLKADVDSLGAALDSVNRSAQDLRPYKLLSDSLDKFFADDLQREIAADGRWQSIYTVFAGGDDLLLVGPWDVMFDFAGLLRQRFDSGPHIKWSPTKLSLSAGMAVIKPKHPIKHAVTQAEELLEEAKNRAAIGAAAGRNQFAAFGQIWKWSDHAAIADTAQQWGDWVRHGIAQRGWLHTLLELSESRTGGTNRSPDLSATARLAYHIARNYPGGGDQNLKRAALRQWADRLLEDFDERAQPVTRFLPAIIRHALTATRNVEKEE